jgi:hypothetical protein
VLQAQLKDVPFFSSLSKRELTTVAPNTDELDMPAVHAKIVEAIEARRAAMEAPPS